MTTPPRDIRLSSRALDEYQLPPFVEWLKPAEEPGTPDSPLPADIEATLQGLLPCLIPELSTLPPWAWLRKEDGGYVLVIGSAHTGFGIAPRIRTVIEQLQPDMVAVELCIHRAGLLTGTASTQMWVPSVQKTPSMLAAVASLPGMLFMQKHMAAEMLLLTELSGEAMGSDMLAAASSAARVDATLALADRPLPATLARMGLTWRAWCPTRASIVHGLGSLLGIDSWVSWAREAHLAHELRRMQPYVSPALLEKLGAYRRAHDDAIELGKTLARSGCSAAQFEAAYQDAGHAQHADAQRLVELVHYLRTHIGAQLAAEMTAVSNGLAVIEGGANAGVMSERDEVLAANLRCMPGKYSVAVVGAAHVPGIVQHWGLVSDARRDELYATPSPWRAVTKPLGVATATLALLYGATSRHNSLAVTRSARAVLGTLALGGLLSAASTKRDLDDTSALCQFLPQIRKLR